MQQPTINHSLQIDLEKLPSIPHALLKLFEIIHDPEVSFSEITEIIQSDPALTTRIMSVANSGAYYPLNDYKDFHRLVVALGLNIVRTITINSVVQQFFSQFNIDDDGALARFWHSSLTTACVARNLAHITGYDNKDEVYIAGLLHKVGKLICLLSNSDEYLKQLKDLDEQTRETTLTGVEAELTKMEQSLFGSSIPEIGAWLIRQFDQKSLLSDAILYQRESAEQLIGAPHLVQLINLAHKLAEPGEDKSDVFEDIAAVFDLNQPVLEDLLERSYGEVKKAAQSLSIKINDDNSIETDNEEVQIKLAENVRTIALSSSLQQGDYRSEKELIDGVMNNIRILFGLSHCLFFTYDDKNNCLNAQYGFNVETSQLGQFNIPLDASNTLPMQSLNRGVPIFSNDENAPKSVLDRQLLRILDSEETLCIPFMETLFDKSTNSNEKYGLIVAGINATQSNTLKREKGLLYEFSRSTSEVIARDRNTHRRIQNLIEEEKTEQSLEIRKLVHEANNPLSVIRNYLQILSHKLSDSDDDKLQGQIEILMEEVERVGSIVLRMNETPERSVENSGQVRINDLINRLLSIFKESLFLKSGIEVIVDFDSSIPVIESNANSLKQIITNLLKNAVEAMPDGGVIHIATHDQVNYNGQQFIELSVIDNGPGIPESIMKNLFTPVQSTKLEGHSGLGLSIIKNLVNDLGGTIRGSNRHMDKLSSSVDQKAISGAEFIILLPRRLNQSSA